MARPVKITTPFPTVLETARELGVSKRDAMLLSEMAERSVKTGDFSISGLSGSTAAKRKPRSRPKAAKAANDGAPSSKKK